MITNKDIRVENGFLIINGNKYPLDGQSPEAIMQIVEDNSDSTPTENSNNPVKSGGVFTALSGKADSILEATSVTMSVNTTYQIPSDFLTRKIIIITLVRSSLAGSQILLASQIATGSASEGVKIVFGSSADATQDKFAIITVSKTGLITMVNLTNMPTFVYLTVAAI